MAKTKDKDFNKTLRRMMEAPPKEHKDMKKGRPTPTCAQNAYDPADEDHPNKPTS